MSRDKESEEERPVFERRAVEAKGQGRAEGC